MKIRMNDFRVVKNEILDADGIPCQRGEATIVFPLPKRGGSMGRAMCPESEALPSIQGDEDKATLLERYASQGWAFEAPTGEAEED